MQYIIFLEKLNFLHLILRASVNSSSYTLAFAFVWARVRAKGSDKGDGRTRREPTIPSRNRRDTSTAKWRRARWRRRRRRSMSYVSEKRDVEFADFTHEAGNISGNCAVGNGRGKATAAAPPRRDYCEYRCDTFSPCRSRRQSNAVSCRIRAIHECITVLLSRHSCLFRRFSRCEYNRTVSETKIHVRSTDFSHLLGNDANLSPLRLFFNFKKLILYNYICRYESI